MKKRIALYGLKVIAAGVLAFVILNLICMIYYNLVLHHVSDSGSTDYVWEKNTFYSRGTEGFACGTTDKNGFNNLQTFDEGKLDILVMGSSHLEGFNVAQDENLVYRLNERLKVDGINLNAYNIGVSGHTLTRCLYNFSDAIDEFKPNKYVAIEVSSLKLNKEEVKDAIANKLEPLESQENQLIVMAQKFPFLRRCYGQLKAASEEDAKEKELFDKNDLNILLARAAEKAQESGVELIIVFNCTMEFDENGDIVTSEDYDSVQDFREICEKNNITFVHMHDRYSEFYDETNRQKLPHGFPNSRAGFGHLNKYGHQLMGDELADTIVALEERK